MERKYVYRVTYIKKTGAYPVTTHVGATSEDGVAAEIEKRGPVARILEIERIS